MSWLLVSSLRSHLAVRCLVSLNRTIILRIKILHIIICWRCVAVCTHCVWTCTRRRMRMNNVKIVGWMFVGRCDCGCVCVCARLHIEPANKRTNEQARHPSVLQSTLFRHVRSSEICTRTFSACRIDILPYRTMFSWHTHHTPCTPAIRCSRCAI